MIKTGNPIISIYTEMTPNPETMKFVANKLLYPGKSIDFQDESSVAVSPLAMELFSFPFIKSVFIKGKLKSSMANGDTATDDSSWKSMLLPGYNNLFATNFIVSGFGVISVYIL